MVTQVKETCKHIGATWRQPKERECVDIVKGKRLASTLEQRGDKLER